MGTTSTTTKQTLLLVGAGPIGLAAAKAASVDGVATPFGVVDPRRDARRLARETLSCVTYQSMDELNGEGPDVALVSFSSKSEITVPTIERLVSRGCHVVTTCEELACPSDSVRSHLSAACRESGASVVVTGANPGFVMDQFVTTVALAGRNVNAIRVQRRLDTRTRRGPLVAKTGCGLPVDDFTTQAAAGQLGHVGLRESARLVAESLGWEIEETRSVLEPVLGDTGEVLGQHQIFTLAADRARTLVFDLEMSWGAPDPGDRIVVSGEFDIDVEIHGGYPGDEGTTAMVVRAIEMIARRTPDFYRPTDLLVGF